MQPVLSRVTEARPASPRAWKRHGSRLQRASRGGRPEQPLQASEAKFQALWNDRLGAGLPVAEAHP